MSAPRLAVGATRDAAFTSRVIAFTSSAVNAVALELTGPRRSLPGMTMSMFEPIFSMSDVIFPDAPRATVTIEITEATPITMPSVVRTERMVLRLTSRIAMMRIAQIMAASPAARQAPSATRAGRRPHVRPET